MTHYYYDNPLAAAWMAKHFGMVFLSPRREILYFDDSQFRRQSDSSLAFSKQYIIAPTILKILEPKIGDIVLNCDQDPARVIPDSKIPGYHEVSLKYAMEWVGKEAIIILRDGKPFHWPKKEQ